jgi:hypothetical protein
MCNKSINIVKSLVELNIIEMTVLVSRYLEYS